MGFDLHAPVTEHYLVWQHREVLLAGIKMRDTPLEVASTRLLSPAAEKAGPESSEVRIISREVLPEDDIDRAFEAFTDGSIDKAEFHGKTRWW